MFSKRKKRILLVSRLLPWPGSAGSAAHLFDLVSCLHKNGFQIDYLYFGRDRRPLPEEVHKIARVFYDDKKEPARTPVYEVFCQWWSKYVLRESAGKNLATQGPPPEDPMYFDSGLIPREADAFLWTYKLGKPDIIIADYSWLSEIFDLIPRRAKTKRIIFVHDLRIRIVPSMQRMGITGVCDENWNEAREGACLQKADALMVLQEQDEKACRRMAPNVKTIRVGVSVNPVACDPSQEVRGRCMYVGSNALENKYALNWFLSQVWPLVRKAVPESNLTVCGDIGPSMDTFLEGVAFTGRVEDLKPYYAAAQVCLVPHRMEGGMKLKFVDALAHGRVVVANKCGIDAIPEAENRCAFAADEPEAFAGHIIALLTDNARRKRMQEAASEIARERLSVAGAYGALFSYLREKA